MDEPAHNERKAIVQRIANVVSMMETRRPAECSARTEEWSAFFAELLELGSRLMELDRT
jgi:hypothetical protein